jgi:hypothetical protein
MTLITDQPKKRSVDGDEGEEIINRLIFRTRTGLFFSGLLRIFPPLLIIAAVSLFVFWAKEQFNVTTNPNDSQYVSAIIGAFVGGFITLYASYSLAKQEKRGKQISRKKTKIYMPIYDEVAEFLKVVKENPFPKSVNLDGDHRGYWSIPVFETWNKIKEDSRLLIVPKHTAKTLDAILRRIEEYHASYQQAEHIFDQILKRQNSELFNAKPLFVNWGESTFSKFLGNEKDAELFFHGRDIELESGSKRLLSDADVLKFHSVVSGMVNKTTEMMDLRVAQKGLILGLTTLQSYLAWVIRYVERKYENGVFNI